MRLFFLHNSSHKQLFCTAVVPPTRFLRYALLCTKFWHHAARLPVFGHLRQCKTNRNREIINRKLVRLIFLHKSNHKQLLRTAVMSPARFLAHERLCTKTVQNGYFWDHFWGVSNCVKAAQMMEYHH